MEKKGPPFTKSTKVPDAFRVPESGKADAAPTPETLLRKYDLLGKSLWIAMGAGILITLWTIAAFVAGPATPLPTTTETEGTMVLPADTLTTTGSDYSPPKTVEKSAVDATTETKNPPVDQKQQDNTAAPQVRQPARRAPATNKVQPQQTPEKKQQEKDQTYEPTDEQQYQQQQQQQVPKSAD